MAQLTSSFHNIVRNRYALLSLPLIRRGLWSGDTDTATSGSAEAPLVVSGTFTNDDPLATPTNIVTTVTTGGVNFAATGTDDYILATNSASKIDVISGSTFSFSSQWGTTPDAKSRLGNVLQYNKTVLLARGIWDASATKAVTLPSTARSVGVFANTKNTGVVDVLLRVVVRSGNSSVRTQQVLVPAASDIAWRYMGGASCSKPITTFRIEAYSYPATAAQVQIDDIVFIVTDGEDWNVLKIDSSGVYTSGDTITYTANHRYIEDLTPEVIENGSAAIHEGTPFFNFTGDTVAMAFLSASPVTDYWQLVAGTTPVTSSFVATRDRGFLIPI